MARPRSDRTPAHAELPARRQAGARDGRLVGHRPRLRGRPRGSGHARRARRAGCERAVAAAGPFDVLVNSAGTARHGLAAQTSEADSDVVMAPTCAAPTFLTHAVARGLLEAGKTRLADPRVLADGPCRGPETRRLLPDEACRRRVHQGDGHRMARAAGIRVNTVCPTFVETASRSRAGRPSSTPTRRVPTPRRTSRSSAACRKAPTSTSTSRKRPASTAARPVSRRNAGTPSTPTAPWRSSSS